MSGVLLKFFITWSFAKPLPANEKANWFCLTTRKTIEN